MTATFPDLGDLAGLDVDDLEELACAVDLGVWSERRLGLSMAPFHWEWADAAMNRDRLAECAPREFGKSVALTVNPTVWRSIYTPGTWSYLFAQTADQAKALLGRVKDTMESVRPDLMADALEDSAVAVTFANGSRVSTAGAGKRVRGAHPDVIVGDDVLDEDNTATAMQRRKIERWWFGSVANMAHPGTIREVRTAAGLRRFPMRPTKIHMVGTPFHEADLLLAMRTNARWHFRRYQAECPPEDRVPGTWAVEVA